MPVFKLWTHSAPNSPASLCLNHRSATSQVLPLGHREERWEGGGRRRDLLLPVFLMFLKATSQGCRITLSAAVGSSLWTPPPGGPQQPCLPFSQASQPQVLESQISEPSSEGCLLQLLSSSLYFPSLRCILLPLINKSVLPHSSL